MITLVVVMCYAVGSQSICREEIVIRSKMTKNECYMSQPMLAQWKAASIFKDDSWWIARIQCEDDNYVVKEAT